jgi:hypothetical protein
VSGGVLQVLPDVTLRIDDGRDAGVLVRDQIGGVREAAEVILLQEHHRTPLVSDGRGLACRRVNER